MEPSSDTQPIPHAFVVYTDDNTHRVQGRREAVRAAKEMSRRTWRGVHVKRDDERVEMKFRRGALQDYRFETRARRRQRS